MEITQTTHDSTESVILKTKDSVPTFRSRQWAFTLNNYTEDEITQITQISGVKVIFGKEVGEQGTPHLQGYIEFSNAKTLTAVKKYLNLNRVHLEPSYKNRHANINYCSKGEIVRNDFGVVYRGNDLPKPSELYDWQLELLSILEKKPDDRIVYWYYEPIGNSGKSKFGKYLTFHNKNITLTTATKSADILTCVDERYNTYIFDFPRTLGMDYCPYNAIEQVKNGFITDSKLKKQSRVIMFDPPHIMCFSNCLPDKTKLSADRWRIFNIYTKTWEC